MSVYVTGDIHGYPIRLTEENIQKIGVSLTKEDKLLICGDFGLPWYNDEEELQCIEWLAKKPFEILFIDGNHENFDLLNDFPVEARYGGKVHKLRDNIYHLMRGEVYEIEGKTFFTFGGATSFDKHMREENISWWKEEIFTKEEQLNAIQNLERKGNNVDFVITHTAPRKFLTNSLEHLQGADACMVSEFLDELSCKINYEKWYFGHFHIDVKINEVSTCMYENIVEIK